MFNKILVVCIGNICRSPIGEALLKKQAQLHNLALTVSSAGIGALVGHPADPTTQELLLEQGISCSDHRARQLTSEMLVDSELILVMEKGHRLEIERLFPHACGKVHLIGKWSGFEVSDPYRKPRVEFEQAYRLIAQGIEEWKMKLWN